MSPWARRPTPATATTRARSCTPGAAEVCNGLDDDCDGATSEDQLGPPVSRASVPLGGYADRQLRGADFACQQLSGVSFAKSDLRRSSFRRADLRGADFSGADLRWADFEGADLRGAKHTGSYEDDWESPVP